MQKWEYRIVSTLTKEALNALGEEGWELVSVVVEVSGDAYSTSSSKAAYLKRPLDDR
jgi:hypothetical protein